MTDTAIYLTLGYAFLHFFSDRHMTDESMRGRAWVLVLWPLWLVLSLLFSMEDDE